MEKENNILFNWCVHANRDTDIKMQLEVGGFMFITNRWVCSRPHHLLWKFSGINLVQSDDKQPQSIKFIILTDQATKAKCTSSRKGGIKPKSNSHTPYMHAASLRRKGATLHFIWNRPGNPSLTVLILTDESSFQQQEQFLHVQECTKTWASLKPTGLFYPKVWLTGLQGKHSPIPAQGEDCQCNRARNGKDPNTKIPVPDRKRGVKGAISFWRCRVVASALNFRVLL